MSEVLVVLVLYNYDLSKVKSIRTLLHIMSQKGNKQFWPCRLLVFDNSTTRGQSGDSATYVEDLDFVEYYRSAENLGTSGAYRYALKRAKELDMDWVLILDQDSDIPRKYFDIINEQLSRIDICQYDAVAPSVFHGDSRISPCAISKYGRVSAIKNEGGEHQVLSCISSYTLFRISSLENLNTMPTTLWLDYVDHWLFYGMHLEGKDVFILDLEVQHDLSVNNMNNVPYFRLKSILDSEEVFCRSIGKRAVIYFYFRLMFRYVSSLRKQSAYRRNITQWFFCKIMSVGR